MISETAASQGIVVSESIISRGVVVKPQPGSALGHVVASIGCPAAIGLPVSKFEADAETITYLSVQSPRTELQYKNFLEMAKPAISSYLLFLREKIRPTIVYIVDEFKKQMEIRVSDPAPAYKIVINKLHSVFSEPSILELVSEQKSTTQYRTSNTDIGRIDAGIKTPQELQELFKTGDRHADDALNLFVVEKGDGFLIEAWTYMIGGGLYGDKPASLIARMNGLNGCDIALAVLLMANKLYDNPPADVRMSLIDYNAQLGRFQAAAATQLSYTIADNDVEIEDQTLIQKVLAHEIYVNGEVYEKWLADGGNAQVLYAIANRNFSYKTVFEITQNIDRLLKEWAMTCAMIAQETETNKYLIMRDALVAAVKNTVNENFELCFCNGTSLGIFGENNANYTAFKKRFDEYMRKLTQHRFEDIWDVAHEVACLCIFPEKDALPFFLAINHAKKTNPDLSDRECVSLAAVEYIVKFVVSMFSITHIKA